ncbi:hypothetical protein [Rheinheimera gaetbuli]
MPHAEKTLRNNSQPTAAVVSQQGEEKTAFQFADARYQLVKQMQLQQLANNSGQVKQWQAIQSLAAQHPIQRKLVIDTIDVTAWAETNGVDAAVNDVYQQMCAHSDVTANAELLAAVQTNAVAIKRQLTKWIENKPGRASASDKSHPDYGRKQQNRSYENLYNLARSLLGWVETKPIRHAEKELANQVYENAPLQAALNGLLGKLYFKVQNLAAEGLVDPARHQAILLELQAGLSIAKGRFDENHRWVQDDTGEHTKLGHYQRYHRATAQKDTNPNIDHGVPDNQLEVLQNPVAYSLKDKMILLHDLMEYFGRHQSWNPTTAGQDLLPVETRDETMVTTAVDTEGERIGAVSMSDGDTPAKNRARGMGKTTASRDEEAPSTKLARYLKLPVWAGQSMTTVRMMKLAQWVGASNLENSALAMTIFAYWRKDYDHRSDFAYHTLFEVLDVAKNFGVTYKMQSGNHIRPEINIEHVLAEARQKYQQLVQITQQFAAQLKGLNIGEPLRSQIAQLFQDIKDLDAKVKAAFQLASAHDQNADTRTANLNVVVLDLEYAVEKQRQIKALLDTIPIPMDLH